MVTKTEKQMAKMVDAVQPHCDENIVAAMTCSQAGSMSSLVIPKILTGLGGGKKPIKIPNPAFIAVGSETIYIFDYKPRGFKFKIKKEVMRWSRDELSIETENEGGMATFSLTTGTGDSYPFEIPTLMGGKELVEIFLNALLDG